MIEEKKLKLKKEYRFKNTDKLKPNRKEQVLLIYLYSKLTSLHGSELIEHLINVILPMRGNKNESIYNVRTQQRFNKRKVLKKLEKDYLELKEV